jgi:hypothetical protein
VIEGGRAFAQIEPFYAQKSIALYKYSKFCKKKCLLPSYLANLLLGPEEIDELL